jgi:hypothetical protein
VTPSPSLVDALERRAERGAPRGAAAVLAAARSAPLAEVVPLDPRRRQRQLAGAAAALLVVGAGAVAIAVAPGSDAPSAGTGDPYCDALAAPGTDGDPAGDLVVYLVPGVSDARRAEVADALRADPRVSSAVEADQGVAYERFRELFADEPVMLESVEASELPSWVALELDDPADAPGMADELAVQDDVYEAIEGAGTIRVLDLLVWPAADERIGGMGGTVTTRRYGPSWLERAARVEAEVPTEVADDVAVLLDRIERGPQPSPDDPPTPTFEATQAAGAEVRSDAAGRCGLTVPAAFTEPLSTSDEQTTDTTEARSGD